MICRSKNVKNQKTSQLIVWPPCLVCAEIQSPKSSNRNSFARSTPENYHFHSHGNQTWMAEEPWQMEIDEIVNGKKHRTKCLFFFEQTMFEYRRVTEIHTWLVVLTHPKCPSTVISTGDA